MKKGQIFGFSHQKMMKKEKLREERGRRWDVFVVDEQEAPPEPDSGKPVIYAEEAQEIVAAFNYEFVLDCSHHSQAGGSPTDLLQLLVPLPEKGKSCPLQELLKTALLFVYHDHRP